MSKYLVRRLVISIPVLAGISLVLFTILALAPGDPFEELATNPNVPPEVRANLRTQFGLDDPVPVRYARWFTSMLKGDWGFSFVSRVDVVTLIRQRLPTTLFVLGSAQLLGLLVALPIGIFSAVRPYSIFDQNPCVSQGAIVENKRLGAVLSTIQVTQAAASREHAIPFQFQIPLAPLGPGAYTCQVNVVDEVGKKFSFPRARLVLLP